MAAHTNLSVKTPVVLRQNYVMYLEWWDGRLWFHTDILNWTPDIKKQYKLDLEKLENLVSIPLIALVTEDNLKLKKFAKSFNWKEIREIMLNNGTKAFIYASQRNTGE